MARHTIVVLTNATEGQDDAYNEWYNNQHLSDVLALDGFVAAQRFRLSDTSPEQESGHRYLALYEVETDDIEKVQQAIGGAAGTPAMVLSPALASDADARYFTPITDRVTS
jgi:hypothetical protein